MPVPRRFLADDEEVLVDLRPHWVALLFPGLVTVAALALAIVVSSHFRSAPTAVHVLLALVVVVPGCWLALRAATWWGTTLAVTTARLLRRRGFLGRDMVQVRLARIAEVQVHQTVWARVLGTGDLIVELTGGQPRWLVPDVRSPRALQRVITRQLDLVWERGDVSLEDQFEDLDEPVRPRPRRTGAAPAARPVSTWRRSRAGPLTPPSGTPAASRDDQAPLRDRLVELHELYQHGLVTQEEYMAKRSELLDRL